MSCQHLAVVLLSSCYAAGLAEAGPVESLGEESATAADQWEYCLSFSYPLSEKTELAASQTFSQIDGSSLSWSAVHLNLNHQLSSGMIFGFSPSVAFDYERATDRKDGNVVVSQVCCERTAGTFSFTVAPFHEFSWAPGGVSSHCAGLDCIGMHAFSDRLAAGIEAHWKAELNHADPTVDDLYLVPAASLSSGMLSYSLGVALGLIKDSGEPKFRFALGMSL